MVYTCSFVAISDAGGVAKDIVSFKVNEAPVGGTFKVAPSSGVMLEPIFTLSARSWVDEDLPLKYCTVLQKYIAKKFNSSLMCIQLILSTAFSVVNSRGVDVFLATDLGVPVLRNVMIPIAGNALRLRAYVKDQWGAYTIAETTVDVAPNTALLSLSPSVRDCISHFSPPHSLIMFE